MYLTCMIHEPLDLAKLVPRPQKETCPKSPCGPDPPWDELPESSAHPSSRLSSFGVFFSAGEDTQRTWQNCEGSGVPAKGKRCMVVRLTWLAANAWRVGFFSSCALRMRRAASLSNSFPQAKIPSVLGKIAKDRESQLKGNAPFYLPMLNRAGAKRARGSTAAQASATAPERDMPQIPMRA
jgi:hypothetical protein